MKTELSEEEKEKIPEWVDKWTKIGLSTEPLDMETFTENVKECYRYSKIPFPNRIIRVQSPIVGAVASSIANKILEGDAVDGAVRVAVDDAVDVAVGDAVGDAKLDWHYWLGGRFWVSWQAYTSFFLDVCKISVPQEISDRNKAYENTQKSAGYWWANAKFVMVSEPPEKINITNKKLHKDGGMAIRYNDGWGLYYLNGVRVKKEIVMTKAEELDPHLVIEETNAEVRREIVRKIGIERVCLKLNAKSLNKLGEYELLTLDLGDGRIRPYLKMLNPSIHTYHLEGVPPEIENCEQALKWRNGTEEKPEVLT